jgi:phosphopantetheine--protein transferase-like protein
MIEKFGIGIDIISNKRFKELPYLTNKKFYEKIFEQSEINYCLKFKNSEEHFAGKFAIKEAVIKSIKEKIKFSDILIDYLNFKPQVSLTNNLSYKFLVSISHENLSTVAVVISEKLDS